MCKQNTIGPAGAGIGANVTHAVRNHLKYSYPAQIRTSRMRPPTGRVLLVLVLMIPMPAQIGPKSAHTPRWH